MDSQIEDIEKNDQQQNIERSAYIRTDDFFS